jgi:hypothetical protein
MQLCDGSITFHIFNEHLSLNSVWGHLYTFPVAVGFLYRSLSSKLSSYVAEILASRTGKQHEMTIEHGPHIYRH